MAALNSVVGALACAAVLAVPASALAQGGAPAPDFSEPCPALYPGDDASKERLARWMARAAAERGLPRELPVMAAIAESGLRNLRGDSYHGFFGMQESLRPQLQLNWFLDSAAAVRQRRVAQARPDPADDEQAFGIWIADVERPAPENRSRYQTHLAQARELIAGKCAAPVSADTTPPLLLSRIPDRQRPLAAGGLVVSVRCLDQDCLAGAAASVGERTRRAAVREPAAGGYTVLSVPVPRRARRALRAGRSVRALVTVCAADAAANVRTQRRSVLLLP
jgi:hypothetical protein